MGQDTLVKKSPLQGFNISGNYRFYGQHRFFTDPYAIDVANGDPVYLQRRAILLGDASQLPELTLNISGKPSPKTSFGTDLIVWNQNTGGFDYYRNLLLGINLYGNFQTDLGNVDIKAGGIHWHKMTPFTMQAFAGYNRFSVFDRNPWDPQFRDLDRRYSDYLEEGNIAQDDRWANQAFQGILVSMTELPLGLSLELMYGKTQNATGGFNDGINQDLDSTSNQFFGFFQNVVPNNVVAGRLGKTFGKHKISFNTFNRRTYSDLRATEPIVNHVHTADFHFDLNKLRISGEVGVGKYADASQDLPYGEMASIKLNTSKKLTGIPIELHAFRISPNAVNANGEFVNTTIVEAPSAASGGTTLVGANGVLQQTGSAMLMIGQMANNRQGININTDIEPIDDLVISLGNGIATELENRNRQVTYGHAINGLQMSRFWRFFFPSNVGPYGRVSVLFRGVFETVNLTDLGPQGEVVNDKFFNNIEAQVKYKFDLFKRPWYVFYLGMFNSIQPQFSPITVFTEDAYIRYYAHQLESYYAIHPKFILTQYLGWERVIGNYATQLDIESGRPLNQEGFALGGGFDYMMSQNTALYFRHRYFRFEDTSFSLAKFAGHESTLELRIYF
jgi:hypothetical protein